MGLEFLGCRDEVALLDHLEIQYVIEEADEQVNLRDYDENDVTLPLVHSVLDQGLEKHQNGR